MSFVEYRDRLLKDFTSDPWNEAVVAATKNAGADDLMVSEDGYDVCVCDSASSRLGLRDLTTVGNCITDVLAQVVYVLMWYDEEELVGIAYGEIVLQEEDVVITATFAVKNRGNGYGSKIYGIHNHFMRSIATWSEQPVIFEQIDINYLGSDQDGRSRYLALNDKFGYSSGKNVIPPFQDDILDSGAQFYINILNDRGYSRWFY